MSKRKTEDKGFEPTMRAAEEGMDRYRNALRALATGEPIAGEEEVRARLREQYGTSSGKQGGEDQG